MRTADHRIQERDGAFISTPIYWTDAMMDIADTVRNSLILKGLKDEELSLILNITREIRFHENDTIMQEGDVGDTMYILVEGQVGISKTLTMKFGDDEFRKAEKVLTRLRAQDHVIFGEMALIGNDTRSASIVATTDCVLLEIRRDGFVRLIEGSPELGVKLLLNLSQLLVSRLRQSSQDVIRLTTALSIALSR